MPSGKQILLSVLSELSQRRRSEPKTLPCDDLLQAALLFHQSTADETWAHVANTSWLSQVDEDGTTIREGIGLAQEQIFLSDIIEQLIAEQNLTASMRDRFPTLSEKRYLEALLSIWHLLSALQYWEELSSVENGGQLDLGERDGMLSKALTKLKLYRVNPDAYLRGD